MFFGGCRRQLSARLRVRDLQVTNWWVSFFGPREIDLAMQLDLSMILGEPVPTFYVLMDGTGIPVVKKETEGRVGQTGRKAGSRSMEGLAIV